MDTKMVRCRFFSLSSQQQKTALTIMPFQLDEEKKTEEKFVYIRDICSV